MYIYIHSWIKLDLDLLKAKKCLKTWRILEIIVSLKLYPNLVSLSWFTTLFRIKMAMESTISIDTPISTIIGKIGLDKL